MRSNSASARAARSRLFRSAQALALIEGRDYCIADDIKRLVMPCFAHRIIINSRSAGLKKQDARSRADLERYFAESDRADLTSQPAE